MRRHIRTSLLAAAALALAVGSGGCGSTRTVTHTVTVTVTKSALVSHPGGPPKRPMVPLPKGSTPTQARRYAVAEDVIGEAGCLGCHEIGNQGNNGPGPPLTHVGSVLSASAIAEVLRDPQAPMPSFRGLGTTSPAKFRDVVAFLAALK